MCIRDRQYIMEHQKKNVMLKCGVQVITMEMVGRLLMISQKIDVYKRQIVHKNKQEIEVPIISVMGVGYNVSKFDVQLYLREMFLKKGYKVPLE